MVARIEMPSTVSYGLRGVRCRLSLERPLVGKFVEFKEGEAYYLRARVQIESSGPNLPDDAGFAR